MAILLFTVIIKIVLMPLSLWCQWNSIVMVKICLLYTSRCV